jgi:hypothetical protein
MHSQGGHHGGQEKSKDKYWESGVQGKSKSGEERHHRETGHYYPSQQESTWEKGDGTYPTKPTHHSTHHPTQQPHSHRHWRDAQHPQQEVDVYTTEASHIPNAAYQERYPHERYTTNARKWDRRAYKKYEGQQAVKPRHHDLPHPESVQGPKTLELDKAIILPGTEFAHPHHEPVQAFTARDIKGKTDDTTEDLSHPHLPEKTVAPHFAEPMQALTSRDVPPPQKDAAMEHLVLEPAVVQPTSEFQAPVQAFTAREVALPPVVVSLPYEEVPESDTGIVEKSKEMFREGKEAIKGLGHDMKEAYAERGQIFHEVSDSVAAKTHEVLEAMHITSQHPEEPPQGPVKEDLPVAATEERTHAPDELSEDREILHHGQEILHDGVEAVKAMGSEAIEAWHDRDRIFHEVKDSVSHKTHDIMEAMHLTTSATHAAEPAEPQMDSHEKGFLEKTKELLHEGYEELKHLGTEVKEVVVETTHKLTHHEEVPIAETAEPQEHHKGFLEKTKEFFHDGVEMVKEQAHHLKEAISGDTHEETTDKEKEVLPATDADLKQTASGDAFKELMNEYVSKEFHEYEQTHPPVGSLEEQSHMHDEAAPEKPKEAPAMSPICLAEWELLEATTKQIPSEF